MAPPPMEEQQEKEKGKGIPMAPSPMEEQQEKEKGKGIPMAPLTMDEPPPPMVMPEVQPVAKVMVPSVDGSKGSTRQTAEDADKIIKSAGLKVKLEKQFEASPGPVSEKPIKVIRQSPQAGDSVDRESLVTITVPKEEMNNSSMVPKFQLDTFVKNLSTKKLGFPVFSLSDCNSFHTSGYLWGLYAVMMAEKNKLTDGAIAIINFDQHKDLDAPTDINAPLESEKNRSRVASDRWGKSLVQALNKDLKYDACYLSVCNAPDGKSIAFYASGQEKKDKFEKGGKIDDYESFWKEVEMYFDRSIRYVFITIDRDVIKNNFTQWGDGSVTNRRVLQQAMFEVLNPLFGFKTTYEEFLARGDIVNTINKSSLKAMLIGFDVTGLPEHNEIFKYGKPPDDIVQQNDYWVKEGDTVQILADKFNTNVEEIRKLNNETLNPVEANDQPIRDFIKGMTLLLIPPKVITPQQVWKVVNEELQQFLGFAEKLKPSKLSLLPSILRRRDFDRVVFYSGSVSHGEKPAHDDYKKFDCWDYVSCLATRLPDLVGKGNWKYVLNRRKTPSPFFQGWKPFTLHCSSEPVSGYGQKVKSSLMTSCVDLGGFASTAALTDPDTAQKLGGPKKIAIYDLFKKVGNFAQVKPEA